MLRLHLIGLLLMLVLQCTGAFSLPSPSSPARRRNERPPTILASTRIHSPKSLFGAYDSMLKKHPIATKMLTSAVVAGIGDTLVQSLAKPRMPFQFERCSLFMTVAFFYIAPASHIWFNLLEALPTPREFGKYSKTLLMLAVDQTVGAVLISSLFFFAYELAKHIAHPTGSYFNIKSIVNAGVAANRRNLWSTLLANWSCWPLINFVNFLWIPTQYRVLFGNFAAVFWNMHLSNIANKST